MENIALLGVCFLLGIILRRSGRLPENLRIRLARAKMIEPTVARKARSRLGADYGALAQL